MQPAGKDAANSHASESVLQIAKVGHSYRAEKHTIAELLRHARHDGKGMVRRAVCIAVELHGAVVSPNRDFCCTRVQVVAAVLQFWRHVRAMILKRFQYFKRDMKSVAFLILIPLAIMLAVLGIMKA